MPKWMAWIAIALGWSLLSVATALNLGVLRPFADTIEFPDWADPIKRDAGRGGVSNQSLSRSCARGRRTKVLIVSYANRRTHEDCPPAAVPKAVDSSRCQQKSTAARTAIMVNNRRSRQWR